MKSFKVLLFLILPICMTQAWADPPARVGRVAYVEGNVEFRDLTSDDAGPAALNWPVTSNTMISTGDRSRAELRVGPAAVRLDEDSELEIVRLDDTHMILQLTGGAAIAHVPDSRLADEFELDTPRGSVRLDEPSDVRVDVGDERGTGSVQVFSGRARYDDADSGLTISAGHRAEISQDDIRVAESRSDDDFDEWSMARDEQEEASASVRYVSPETTGYEELDRYGNWETTTEYGALWYPRAVPAGWAPYRVGRWVWIQPWGWTWVDSAPWGYAPSHYGRWVRYRHRWCWAPGARVAEPVWAPALVGWVGGNGWSASLSVGSAPAVGWFPLAPHEVYVPSYPVSPAYIRQINITHVAHIDNITYVKGRPNVPMRTNYRNRGLREAVTVLPRDRFERGDSVALPAGLGHAVTEQAWRNAPVSATVPPVIVRHAFRGNGENLSSRFGGTREMTAPPARRAPAVSVISSPRFSGTAPIEAHHRAPEIIYSRPQASAPPESSSGIISHVVVLPHEQRMRPEASPGAPLRVPMHEEPQIRQQRPHLPAPVHEKHGFAPPFSGVQPGSIERARPQEMPGSREARAPAPQPLDTGRREAKPEHARQSEEEHHRHEQQDPFKR